MKIRRVELASGGPVTVRGAIVHCAASNASGAVLRRVVRPWQRHNEAKLNAVQAEAQRLRREHADDCEGAQQALMELYKRHKVNPLGSCALTIVMTLAARLPVLVSPLGQDLPDRLAGIVVVVDP